MFEGQDRKQKKLIKCNSCGKLNINRHICNSACCHRFMIDKKKEKEKILKVYRENLIKKQRKSNAY